LVAAGRPCARHEERRKRKGVASALITADGRA
jgi:hypothetical protein